MVDTLKKRFNFFNSTTFIINHHASTEVRALCGVFQKLGRTSFWLGSVVEKLVGTSASGFPANWGGWGLEKVCFIPVNAGTMTSFKLNNCTLYMCQLGLFVYTIFS